MAGEVDQINPGQGFPADGSGFPPMANAIGGGEPRWLPRNGSERPTGLGPVTGYRGADLEGDHQGMAEANRAFAHYKW